MKNLTEKTGAKVVIIPFSMKENEKDMEMEVPPKAKEYQMSIGNAEQEFIIDVQDGGNYEKNGDIISFMEKGLIKTGKLVSSQKLEEKRQNKKQSSEEMSI